MRLLGSFGLIGSGAFAAGVSYAKSTSFYGMDGRLAFVAFVVSVAIAVAGLIDLLLVAFARQRPERPG